MAGPRIFLPQARLDEWAAEGRMQIEEGRLTVKGGSEGLALAPAVRFMREVGGEGDPNGLVGKVKTHSQLKELGADHYRASVLVGEAA